MFAVHSATAYSAHYILQQLHDAPAGSRLGVSKIWEKVRSCFYWPGQLHDVEKWCAASECCMCVS